MAIVVEPKNYIIGAANIFYREVGVLTPWNGLGITLDDSTLRIVMEWFRPDNLSGVKGPIMGLDVLRRINAEFVFTIPDISGSQITTLIPGSRITPETHADAIGTPFSSTLSAAVGPGDETVTVAATTNLAIGDFIRIGAAAGATTEYRQVTSITGMIIGFRDPLIFDHAAAAQVAETDGDFRGMQEASLYSRMPDSAYKEWAIVVASGSSYHELRLPRGIATADTVEVSAGDGSLSGAQFTVAGRYDGADLSDSPYKLFSPAN